jgi:hypothetical protein
MRRGEKSPRPHKTLINKEDSRLFFNSIKKTGGGLRRGDYEILYGLILGIYISREKKY